MWIVGGNNGDFQYTNVANAITIRPHRRDGDHVGIYAVYAIDDPVDKWVCLMDYLHTVELHGLAGEYEDGYRLIEGLMNAMAAGVKLYKFPYP